METVYLETTIVSYLAAHPSRDLIVSAHQQITHEWWSIAQKRFKIFISETVLEEIRAGDQMFAARRQEFVQDFEIFELNQDVRNLVLNYENNLGLPKRAKVDI